MNALLRTALLLTALLAGSTSASAQCGEWQNLSSMYACGYAGLPYHFAVDAAGDELYSGSQGFCGYHGGTTPVVERLSGASWGGDLNGFDEGFGYGLAFLDDGTGEALYQWGSGQSWNLPPSAPFLKLTPGGWVGVPNPVGIPTAVTVFDDGSGPRFYFAGVSGAIVRLDNGVPQSLGFAVPQESVTGFLAHDDGFGPALYAVGSFTSIGGVAASGVARWNGTAWNALGQGVNPTSSFWDRGVRALSIPHGPLRGLYLGGNFTLAGGLPSNGIARWDGVAWQGIGTSMGVTVNTVGGLTWFDDGRGNGPRLVASGRLQNTGFLRTWDGSQWSSIAGSIEPWGGPVVVFDRPQTPGIDLIVCGLVHPYPQYPTYYEITTHSLEACELTGELYCFGDGSVTACPCGNDSAPAERAGCQHSLGYGGAVRARGAASLSNDTLVIAGSAMTNSSVLYFQGMNSHAPIPFGDGLKCTSGPFVRFATKTNVGGASQYPAAGDLPVSVRGHVNAPGTRHYQARYRNPPAFCTAATFNYTNAVEILWAP